MSYIGNKQDMVSNLSSLELSTEKPPMIRHKFSSKQRPQVQGALKLFLSQPDGNSWQNAPDNLVDSLLTAADSLSGLAVEGGNISR